MNINSNSTMILKTYLLSIKSIFYYSIIQNVSIFNIQASRSILNIENEENIEKLNKKEYKISEDLKIINFSTQLNNFSNY